MISTIGYLRRTLPEMGFTVNATNESSSAPSSDSGPMEAMSLDDDGDDNGGFSSFHPAIFWGINVLFIVILCGLCCYCNYVGEDEDGNDSWFTRMLNPTLRRQQTDAEFQATLRAREERRQKARQMSPAKRQRLLLASFRRHQVYMTVQEQDLILEEETAAADIENTNSSTHSQLDQNHEDDDNDSDDASIHGQLKLSNGNLVPNCCAICLGDYQIGDQVVWSVYYEDKCPHAFHQDCIVDWLVKMQPYSSTPCPCCRQEFTDWEEIRYQRKIKWSSDQAFDPQRIRWR